MKRPRARTLIFLGVVLVCAGYFVASRRPIPSKTVAGAALGTSYTIQSRTDAYSPALHLNTAAVADLTLRRIDEQFSTWRDDSEIARFNAYEKTDWFPVSTDCAAVVARALRISERTGGAFDITVGPLTDLWGFGRNGRRQPPTENQLADARVHVGYELVDARLDPPALRKSSPNIRLDLSAIAKGYAVDVIADAILVPPMSGYMIELGGEVRTRGKSDWFDPWTIGIETPTPGQRRLIAKVDLTDRALATSGDYRNFIEVDGKRLPHVIDPRTGRPIAHNLASVSVIADTCAEADALATALLVMGPDDARAFALKHDLPVLLITRDAPASPTAAPTFTTWTSPAWPK